MPKRSRGFWICDFCELTFDHYDEARTHEIQACTNHVPTDLRSLQRQFPANTMAPLSKRDETALEGKYDQRQQHSHQESQQLTYNPLQSALRTQWIRPLMDASDSDTFLSEADATACRSLEFFHVSAVDSSSDTVVGVRCLYCHGGGSAEHLPPSVDALGDSVRLLIEQHLLSCTTQDVRDILERAIQIRDDGESTDEEEERYKQALSNYCVSKCRTLAIIDRKPPRTGIMMEDCDVPSWTVTKAVATEGESWEDTAIASRSDFAVANESLEPMPLDSLPDEQQTQQPPYGTPLTFPFFQAPNGDWMCRYCCHLPPEYRDQHFIWSTPSKSAPSTSFVNHHMSICREFNRMSYEYYQHAPRSMMGGSQYSYPSGGYGPMWDGSSQGYVNPSTPATNQFLPASGYSQMMPREPPPDMQFDRRESYSSRQRRTGRREVDSTSGVRLSPDDLEPLATTPMQRVNKNETDASTEQSICHLVKVDQSVYDNEGNPLPEESILVVDDDRLLLTDYFFYLMKQLRLVRFSEKDRRTRGGKRENIHVGYGGLQCVHCAKESNARKFFWSNVDRLANSFAEIPGHILKCRHCPETTKNALLQLKKVHPDQMSRLPRGSQKVFFRRMWHRLHDKDPPATPSNTDGASSVGGESASTHDKRSPPSPVDTKLPAVPADSPSRTGSEESIVMFEKPSHEAAKALADAAMQASPPSPSSRVLLAIPEDKEWLSDTDCFVRRQIEVFCATRDDTIVAEKERNFETREGQVGIRCIHCALAGGARANAVSYPFAISGIYEAVREFHRSHLETCPNLPTALRTKLESFKGCSSLSSVLRKYYILSAQALGLHDTRDGIKAGARPIPIGSEATAFAFSDSSVSKEMITPLTIGDTFSELSHEDESLSSRKRKSIESSSFAPDAKRASPSTGLND